MANRSSDASGNFLVVWESIQGIMGQRFDSAGGKLGAEFRVNSYTTGQQATAVVAIDASGNFVVVWDSVHGHDGDQGGIFGQRYNNEGVPQGNEFQVNSYTTSNQFDPSVASDAAGNFVVVWTGAIDQDGSSWGIFGQRYESGGVAQGGEFRVNSYTQGTQFAPSVASDTAGNFVVVWDSYQDGHRYGIFGQRYDSEGVPQGNEFQVNSYTTSEQFEPIVAYDTAGNFVVVWDSRHQDGSSSGAFAQRYDSAGMAQGAEFRVNSYTPSYQRWASVSATGTNQFVVAWTSYDQDGSDHGVFGQRLDFGGASTIHVGDLDRKAKNVGATWRAQVKTLVHDGNHVAESGVLVRFNVSGGVGTRTCTTVASGICEVSVVVGDAVPSLTFTATGLSKAAFSYVSGDNHDPDPDSNGTTIVVNQP